MAKTIQERTIQELTDRLAEVQAERDLLQAQIGHLNRFLVKVLLEAQIAQNQLRYFKDPAMPPLESSDRGKKSAL